MLFEGHCSFFFFIIMACEQVCIGLSLVETTWAVSIAFVESKILVVGVDDTMG
jgi:hypothetical protein